MATDLKGWVEQARAARGLSLQRLSETLGYTSKTSLERIMKERVRERSLETFYRLAQERLNLTEEERRTLARAVEVRLFGLEASIAAPIVCSQPQHYGYTFDMSNNKLVQDKARLSVVAMLIDTESGVVLNAAQGGVTGSDLNGVVAPTANEPGGQRAIFDLTGRRVAQPSKESLVIVRSADGQVRKQIMRNR